MGRVQNGSGVNRVGCESGQVEAGLNRVFFGLGVFRVGCGLSLGVSNTGVIRVWVNVGRVRFGLGCLNYGLHSGHGCV